MLWKVLDVYENYPSGEKKGKKKKKKRVASKETQWNCDQLMKWLVCIRMGCNYIYISLRMWEYTYIREGELPILFAMSNLYICHQ